MAKRVRKFNVVMEVEEYDCLTKLAESLGVSRGAVVRRMIAVTYQRYFRKMKEEGQENRDEKQIEIDV